MTQAESYRDSRRQHRTPVLEAGDIIQGLINFWSVLYSEEDFLDRFFGPMWHDEATTGEAHLKEVAEITGLTGLSGLPNGWPEGDKGRYMLHVIGLNMAVCAFCVQAMKATNQNVAWSYAVDAARWYGVLLGLLERGMPSKTQAEVARLGADAMHRENRGMKADVFAWLVVNRDKYKSKEKAASAVEGQQPIAHRTAYKWVTDFDKLPPASKR